MKRKRVAMQDNAIREGAMVLVACSDVAYGSTLVEFMLSSGYQVERCIDSAGVLRLSSRRNFDVVVLDLALSEDGDIDLITFIQQKNPATQLVLLFDLTLLERAIDGIRNGAFFYLPKSCSPSDVMLVVEKAQRNRVLESTLDAYEQNVFEELVGQTAAMQRVVEMIRKVAPTDSTVLLLGESGTGKEVLANTLHRLSRRRHMPFIVINCAALPETLLESEMFGHVKGAFTGADQDKRGLFEEADGGTLFLDEVGDMSLITQAKLLRVLQNGDIRPVGSTVTRRVNVRLLAATNRNLIESVKNYTFREDLYFRLNVIQIRIPPLRERIDAIPTLINHFIAHFNKKHYKSIQGVDEHALSLLMHYEFPGNVRELESVIAHAVIMADNDLIHAQDLPDQVRLGTKPRLELSYSSENKIHPVATLAELEASHIAQVLEQLEGNQTLAARYLGISRSTLWRKMKEYDIRI